MTHLMDPERIFILRHAESEEDVDPDIYDRAADAEIGLTEEGKQHMAEIAEELREKLRSNSVAGYTSSAKRLHETFTQLTELLPELDLVVVEDNRIKKQDWGNVTLANRSEIEAERYRIGVLEYAFPGGESGPQLVERIDTFIEWLREEFQREDYPENALIVTHGFNMRLLLMRLLDMSREEFGALAHPPNGFIAELARTDDGYELRTELPQYQPESNPGHVGKNSQ